MRKMANKFPKIQQGTNKMKPINQIKQLKTFIFLSQKRNSKINCVCVGGIFVLRIDNTGVLSQLESQALLDIPVLAETR